MEHKLKLNQRKNLGHGTKGTMGTLQLSLVACTSQYLLISSTLVSPLSDLILSAEMLIVLIFCGPGVTLSSSVAEVTPKSDQCETVVNEYRLLGSAQVSNVKKCIKQTGLRALTYEPDRLPSRSTSWSVIKELRTT